MPDLTGRQRNRREDIDALKGILISLVVLGHNYYFSHYFTLWFSYLYIFHVACFLLLRFYLVSRDNSAWLLNHIIRLLYPHFIFLFFSLLLYYFFFIEKDFVLILQWLAEVGSAIVLENEESLKQASGFRHFWFLPAFFCLSVLLAFFDRCGSWLQCCIILGSMLYIALWGFLGSSAMHKYAPWGTTTIAYLMLPGILLRFLSDKVQYNIFYYLLISSLWISSFSFFIKKQLFISLAGYAPCELLFSHPEYIALHYLFIIITFLFLLHTAWYLRHSIFRNIGKFSLQIFLIHPFIWQIFWYTKGKFFL